MATIIYGERYSHSSMNEGMPNFVQLANAYGINAKQISSPNNLKAIARSIGYTRPMFN